MCCIVKFMNKDGTVQSLPGKIVSQLDKKINIHII